ncbi:MAG: succinate dehydrogenase, cytochrome b556 subunit [Hoeflea sp.]|uniref:succinate dehydrogenase, cytochrome b556 subunit n=1 Tax=Hoeflea sp. TaxID=1940281 RepID=UPI001E010B46|nr:succinate dehydrogenase, cytochrome b556 subunit [Hoeflea sp.]MBU4529853.1 succinate dehydrogenase, cytochrome b556 subunit [Alphaproteobacteria bacterium]MBU4547126.1 succinate dehydrogenase, cytochrome b556 subunit [Alphaproteobacteria bacterium]MBU4548739.1 succinate dehydrogenase, cytochrome b556 subunit [Alphaproteobacteria bacterium]MBV1722346.1 succinate dehydrogenase, cytochrome b556 subunit [Hoeflea sp.]MBV1762497.1 succinate dehydrogenase, cytochrome b556 subunit [Hoeflea sp.]
MSNVTQNRPLSPHLSIYKQIPTMMMSIMHRFTGMALYAGTLLVAWWLVAAASGEAYFDWVNSIFGSLLGRLVLLGYTWALIHHMLGGIKHLAWDMGYGFEKEFSTKVARLQVVASVVLTLALWIIGYMAR